MNDLLDRIIAIYPDLADRMDLFASGDIVLRDDSDNGAARIEKWTYEQPQPSVQALAAATPSTVLSKRLEVAKRLDTLGKGKDRLLIQQVIAFVESQAPALATQYGLTLPEALQALYTRNKSYRECKDCENACRAIEVSP